MYYVNVFHSQKPNNNSLSTVGRKEPSNPDTYHLDIKCVELTYHILNCFKNREKKLTKNMAGYRYLLKFDDEDENVIKNYDL